MVKLDHSTHYHYHIDLHFKTAAATSALTFTKSDIRHAGVSEHS